MSMKRVFVAGHRGLVGSAIVRRLHNDTSCEILTASREQLDLRDQAAVNYWFKLRSSCIYPRSASQPMAEEQLLTGALEPTNEAYGIAKIAGIKLCEAYRAQ